MRYLRQIILLLFFSSCATEKSIVGLYGKCDEGYFACSQIELKSDNTFEYYIYMDVGGAQIKKGIWKSIAKDTIVLNTYEQPENPRTKYIGKVNPQLKDKIRIKILDRNGPIELANVLINNGEQGKTTNSNGIVEFDSKLLNNIEYGFLSNHEFIPISNSDYNEIEIIIKDLEYGVMDFLTDYKIYLRNRELILNTGKSLKKTDIVDKKWN